MEKTESPLSEAADRLGFALILCALALVPVWFNIYSYDQFELPKLTLLRIITVLALFAFITKTLLDGRIQYRPTPLDIPMILLLISNIVSTVFSFAPNLSFRGEYENFAGSLSNINYILLYYLTVAFLKNRQRIKYAFLTLSISTLIVTLYGVAQFFGFDFIQWSEASVIKGRYFSSMGNPNFLGALIIMAIPFCIIFMYITFSEGKKTIAVLSASAVILMYIALFGTQSRGPFLGFVFSVAFIGIYAVKSAYKLYIQKNGQKGFLNFVKQSLFAHKYAWLTALILFVVAIILSLTVGNKATARITESLADIKGSLKQSRLHIWYPALKMIKEHPLFGTGIDTFKTVFPSYEGIDFAQIDGANVSSRTAHNEYLNYGATSGLFGLAAYLMLLYSWAVSALRSFSRENEEKMKLYMLASSAAVIAYLTQNFFSFGVAAINTFFYILLAAHSSHYILTRNMKPKEVVLFKKNGFTEYILIILSIIPVILGISYFYSFYRADVYYNRGRIFGNAHNRWDSAVQEHLKAVKICPDEVKYHVYLGLAYERYAMGLNDPEKRNLYLKTALAYYDYGVKLNPGNSYYWANKGRIYSVLAQTEDPKYFSNALDNFQEAVKRAPVTGLFYSNMMDVYQKTGQQEKAALMLEKVVLYDRKLASNIYFNMGTEAYNKKDLKSAYMNFMQAINLNPSFEPGLFNFGITAATVGDTYNAVAALSNLLAINPDFEKRKEAEHILNSIKNNIKKY